MVYKLIDHLYVGPGKIPIDEDIDVVISLDCGAKPIYRDRKVSHCLDIRDFDVEPIYRIAEALELIHNYLREGKKVYVHCRAGCGRTGTVAIAYLILIGYDIEDAYNIFYRVRGCGPEEYRQRLLLEHLNRVAKKLTIEEIIKLMKDSRSLEDFIIKTSR